MDRTRTAALLASLALVACSGDGALRAGVEPSPTANPSPAPSLEPADRYDYEAPIPRTAKGIAADLTELTAELHDEIDIWVKGGAEPGPAARPVLFRAVRQQRFYRHLAAKPRLYERVRPMLERRLANFSDKVVRASTRLRKLAPPLDEPPDWKIHRPAPPAELLRYYRKGERLFDIPWEVLASVNFIETRFGRILGPSSAGARGPMQFMPATWDQYGNGGNINDPHDSIVAAARYLSASGGPERMWDALFAYNRSNAYVRAILIYARQMMRDPSNYYAFYNWQVYVRTKDGDVQMSGPGRDL